MIRFSLLLTAVTASAQIYSPPEGASFPAGPIRVIAQTEGKGELKLDGKAVAGESPHPGVVTAMVTVSPGVHELTLSDQKIRFASGPADGFKNFRAHPPVATCTSCHAVRNNRWRFIRASLSNVCSQCHSKETFPAKHTHGMDVLPDCQLCHDPHGGTAAALMKMDREKSCSQCHALQK